MADEESQPAPLGMLPFAVTIFWGAFLLFLVQPLIGKYILPWFGGTPGVWTTCLLFFQMLLLGGYAYAHCLNHYLPIRKQVIVHGVLLALAVITLPITPTESLKPIGDESPTAQILLLLTVSIGLPYLVLSATGPLIQAWFAKARPGQSPYRLYALSNVGSLLALLGFPFVVEPWTARSEQVNWWSLGMVVYAAVCGYLAWHMRGIKDPKRDTIETAENPSLRRRAATWGLWFALPACGTALLMATTNKMCQDVAVVPFLWVLPLALYLITFIISFDSPRWYIPQLYVPALLVSWVGVWWALFGGVEVNILWQVGVLCLALFLSCMVCHGELYRLRPEPARLTQYFLAISAGGALGGFFVAVLAPMIFDGYWEYHISLWVAALLFVGVQALRREEWRFGKWQVRMVLAGCWGAVCFGLLKDTAFDAFGRIVITVLPLLVGWGGAAAAQWILRELLGNKENRLGSPEVVDGLSAFAGVMVAVGILFLNIPLIGGAQTVNADATNSLGLVQLTFFEGSFPVMNFWNQLNPGIWLAAGLLFLNLFVWLSVDKWKGVGREFLARMVPLKTGLLWIVTGVSLVIVWATAYFGIGYWEEAVWAYADKDSPPITLGGIVADKLNITVAVGNEKAFGQTARAGLALAITVPLSVLLWLGMRRQEAWGLRRWGTIFVVIPAMAVLAAVLTIQGVYSQQGAHHVDRNFYGTIKITHWRDSFGDNYRLLQNGRITHGFQYMEVDGTKISRKDENGTEIKSWSDSVVTYYTSGSGVGMAMELMKQPRMRVGVVGLGVGTMAGFADPGDVFVFYDINPLVVDLSLDESGGFNKRIGFTYCVNARKRGAEVEIVLGDARLKMEREEMRNYDVIVLDAFSSDSIPVHLLTNETMTLYDRHLAEGGVIAVHISNRYLNLEPVVRRLAQGDPDPDRPRAPFAMISVDTYEGAEWEYACNWILLTRNERLVQQMEENGFFTHGKQAAKDLAATVQKITGNLGKIDETKAEVAQRLDKAKAFLQTAASSAAEASGAHWSQAKAKLAQASKPLGQAAGHLEWVAAEFTKPVNAAQSPPEKKAAKTARETSSEAAVQAKNLAGEAAGKTDLPYWRDDYASIFRIMDMPAWTAIFGPKFIYIVVQLGALALIIIPVAWCEFFRNTLREFPGEYRKLDPNKTWLLLVPLFGLYWNFVAVRRLTDSCNAYFESNETTINLKSNYYLGLAFCLAGIVFAVGLGLVVSGSISWATFALSFSWLGPVTLVLYWKSLVQLRERLQPNDRQP